MDPATLDTAVEWWNTESMLCKTVGNDTTHHARRREGRGWELMRVTTNYSNYSDEGDSVPSALGSKEGGPFGYFTDRTGDRDCGCGNGVSSSM